MPDLRDALGTLDLFGDDFVGDPHPWLDTLRADAPVHLDRGTGLWLVSRHADIRQVLLDTGAFRPDNAQQAVTRLPTATLRVLARAGFGLPPALANNGTDSHPGLRRVVTRFFNAQRVAAAVPVIGRVAGELLAAAAGDLRETGRSELFTGFAQVLPCRVLMELLGITGVDPATLIRWSDASLELFWGRPSPSDSSNSPPTPGRSTAGSPRRCTTPGARRRIRSSGRSPGTGAPTGSPWTPPRSSPPASSSSSPGSPPPASSSPPCCAGRWPNRGCGRAWRTRTDSPRAGWRRCCGGSRR
ncbi:hypothetical protein ACFQ60_44600 [Streptomyces zhihengii]